MHECLCFFWQYLQLRFMWINKCDGLGSLFQKSCFSWCPMLTQNCSEPVSFTNNAQFVILLECTDVPPCSCLATCHVSWCSLSLIRRGLGILCEWSNWLEMLQMIWIFELCTCLDLSKSNKFSSCSWIIYSLRFAILCGLYQNPITSYFYGCAGWFRVDSVDGVFWGRVLYT